MLNINELKLKYGRIFKATTSITQIDIYFHLITKQENDKYNSLVIDNTVINSEAEEYIFDCAVVYPDIDFIHDKLLFGEYHSIAESIVQHSGFYDLDQFTDAVKQKRISSVTLIDQIFVTVMKAFPIYKLSDLETMNYEEIAKLLSLAEVLLEYHLNIPGAEVPGITEEVKQPRGNRSSLEGRPIPDIDSNAIERQRANALEALKASRRDPNLF